MPKYLLVDGFNMAFRAYYAVHELARSDGFPTNALYGWVRSMWKLVDDQKPDETIVFFDLGGALAKLALLPKYKANRGETPEDFEKQVPIIKALTQAMGFGIYEEYGVESDDILAAYANRLCSKDEDARVMIVSADKDFAQSVTDRIHMLLPPPTANPRLGWRVIDPEGVEAKFGVKTTQIADYLSLIGDTSDNIPGIPGVGPKTAVKWLKQYNDIEGVASNANSLKPVRFQEIVPTMSEQLAINRKIITFDPDCGPEFIPSGSVDSTSLFEILEEMEMITHLKEAKKRYSQGELVL